MAVVYAHPGWIVNDEILTWPKCILWHGWCTFHLTADKAESLAQVSVNKSTNASTVCAKTEEKRAKYLKMYEKSKS